MLLHLKAVQPYVRPWGEEEARMDPVVLNLGRLHQRAPDAHHQPEYSRDIGVEGRAVHVRHADNVEEPDLQPDIYGLGHAP